MRTKTTVAQVAVALVAAAASVQAVAQVQWAQRFLEDEDLSAEEDAARKAVYLVTLPHPGQAAQGTQGLRAPDSLTREQVVQMILDAVAHPAYQDPAAQSRHGPSIRVEQMVVYRELHAPDEQGIAHAHFHIADPSQNPANKPGLSGTPSDGGCSDRQAICGLNMMDLLALAQHEFLFSVFSKDTAESQHHCMGHDLKKPHQLDI